MLNGPLSPWPSFTEEEAEAVAAVLRSNRVNYWTGSIGRTFESEFAEWCGAKHAVALANGTLALDLAVKALGIGPGDEVVVTPRSFIASVSCVVNAGAVPVFADVDHASGNITPETIEAVLTPRTKAVICVHLAGWPCDMDPIMDLGSDRGFVVIEDCAQAHGARYKGRPVGGIGHLGAWSFCQDKIMTLGGEGGLVTTNDPEVADRVWSLKDHGKRRNNEKGGAQVGFRWLHDAFGTNARMTEIQSSLGRIQLARMPEWHERRTANATALASGLVAHAGPDGPIRLPAIQCTCRQGAGDARKSDCAHAFYKFYGYVRPERLAPGWTRDRIAQEISAGGVPCFSGSCPEIYLEQAFEDTGWRPSERLPVARELGETSLMWLVHPTLTADEIRLTVDTTSRVLSAATRG